MEKDKSKQEVNWDVVTVESSSHIKFLGFLEDPHKSRILVGFKNGDSYIYGNCTREEWEALRKAESKGKHLAQHIKGHKPYKKIKSKGKEENGRANNM